MRKNIAGDGGQGQAPSGNCRHHNLNWKCYEKACLLSTFTLIKTQ